MTDWQSNLLGIHSKEIDALKKRIKDLEETLEKLGEVTVRHIELSQKLSRDI